jgi:hypothetical protein
MLKMKKPIFLLLCFIAALQISFAQDEEVQEKKPFKEHLFVGGSVSLSFYNSSFMIGGNPDFGYSIGKWVDVGVVANYIYTSEHFNNGDYLHQSVYGGGAFAKIYPIRSVFLQAQFEHNWISQKYFRYSSTSPEKDKVDVNSLLVGAGYTSGRFPGQPFYYFSILIDVANQLRSPYLWNNGNGTTDIIPIIRAGVQIPLFQPKQEEYR